MPKSSQTRSEVLHVVVLSGAGISRESGLKTFRDGDGLWEGYEVQEVATPEAWRRNPELVQRFYNERRKAVRNASPNDGHLALVDLEESYRVTIITQNIDDLHERAGSSTVLHLHGEILKSQSESDPSLVYPIEGDEIVMGAVCDLGSQLRPHVVWFGEPVPMMDVALRAAAEADIFIIVGTSLVVYPAAGLVEFVPRDAELFLVDPNAPRLSHSAGRSVQLFEEAASTGVRKVVELLLQRENPA